MNNRIILVAVFIFSLLQGPFFPPVFLEGFLAMFMLSMDQGRSGISLKLMASLFLSGLMFDLFSGKTLGVTSILFFVAFIVLSFFGENVSRRNPLVLACFAAGIDLIRSKLLYGGFALFPSIFCFVLSFVIFKFFYTPQRLVFR